MDALKPIIDLLILLGINPVAILVIIFLFAGIRLFWLDKILSVLKSEMLKDNILFWFPLLICIPVVFIFGSTNYLKDIIVNFAFSGFLFKAVKNFLPKSDKKDDKKPRGAV